ncbi:MAG: nucleotide-utilizing enzyme [Pseudomonadota bacterium]
MRAPSSLWNPQAPRAVYLAIGTELTSGQITNRNAAWVSERLEKQGIPVTWHLTVPDDRGLMLEAMRLAAEQAELVFISGGLGPTTDDFTREVIAEWWSAPLEWHEPSWVKVVERLRRRGLEAPESNRQQAYFPRGARVLSNREGTADAFLLERSGLSVVVLPGPPREIQAVWEDHLRPWLSDRFGTFAPIEPLKWQVLGRSEAEIGEWVEEAVQGSGLITGYRASPPYVEVKIWVPSGSSLATPEIAKAIQALEQKVGPWTVTRNQENLLDQFFQAATDPLRIVDGATRGWLADRIWSWARSAPERAQLLESRRLELIERVGVPVAAAMGFVQGELNAAPEDRLTLALGPVDAALDFPWGIRRPVSGGSQIETRGERCAYPQSMRERQQKFQVEALFFGALRELYRSP